MNDLTVAKRYARALFELAEKEGNLQETDALLHQLVKTLDAQPKVLLLISSPVLSLGEKHALALKLLPTSRQELLERFLCVLVDKKRFSFLPAIQQIFHDRFEKKCGRQEVEMISAVPLSEQFHEKLEAVLTKKLQSLLAARGTAPQAKIRLISRIDKNLLGGFILRFNEKEVDCSFRTRVNEIRQNLFGSPEEGIA